MLMVLAILSLGVQDLKIGLGGISIGQKGDFFVYEILIVLFCLLTFAYVAKTQVLKKPNYLLPFLFFAVPLVFNYVYGKL